MLLIVRELTIACVMDCSGVETRALAGERVEGRLLAFKYLLNVGSPITLTVGPVERVGTMCHVRRFHLAFTCH